VTVTLAAVLAVVCVTGMLARSPGVALAALPVVGLLAARALVHGLGHARLARRLERSSRAGSIAGVAIRWSSSAASAGAAAVAGLCRPRIFVDPRLLERLTEAEMRAVLLHERCHQIHRDPARLLAIASAAPLLRRLPGGPARLEAARARVEIDADRYALRHGATRAELARALLELDSPGTPLTAAAFPSATELRLQVLLGKTWAPGLAPRRSSLPATAGVLALCALAAVHHAAGLSAGLGCFWSGC
jgi:beta-lactamase regulating signal transducer with metallopeptidase domain